MLETTTQQTSAAALNSLTTTHLASKTERIFEIIVVAKQHGIDDMSGKEIQHRYEFLYGQRIDSGEVSARLAGLRSAKRIERCRIARECLVTGREIVPVRVVYTQARLAA